METTKKASAQRQTEVAIRLFYEGKLDCVITLAGAAEGLLPSVTDPFLFRTIRQMAPDIDLNAFVNWLKHEPKAETPETVVIDEFEAAFTIARAITKFIAVYHQSCDPFEAFLRKAHKDGQLPRLYRLSN